MVIVKRHKDSEKEPARKNRVQMDTIFCGSLEAHNSEHPELDGLAHAIGCSSSLDFSSREFLLACYSGITDTSSQHAILAIFFQNNKLQVVHNQTTMQYCYWDPQTQTVEEMRESLEEGEFDWTEATDQIEAVLDMLTYLGYP